jgi:N-methylhydantoinase A
VEDPGTTIVIHPGNAVSVDGFGNIRITVGN